MLTKAVAILLSVSCYLSTATPVSSTQTLTDLDASAVYYTAHSCTLNVITLYGSVPLTTVKNPIVLLWVLMTPCSLVDWYQRSDEHNASIPLPDYTMA